MAHRGPKSQRPGRRKIAETDTHECYEADGQNPVVQGIAHAIHDVVQSTGEKFQVPPENQILGACIAVAMLTKRLGADEQDVVGVLRQCMAGVHYSPHGFETGSA